VIVKAQCLPFSQIPHTTRLFTDFLAYTASVRQFYPRSHSLREWLREEVSRISYESSRRARVADILRRQNQGWNASAETLASVERLRSGAAAVVTGQQIGLFGGPTFAIYKALTAVKLAEEARAAGVDAVPVFWLATSDHDLEEVNHVALLEEGGLKTLTTPSHGVAEAPVSEVRLGEEILPVVEEAAKILGDSEVTRLLRAAYRPGETLGSAFARLYAQLFAKWGVVLLDPSDAELHRLAAPIYRAAIERAAELSEGLLDRGKALEAAGYYQQVKITESSVLLFTLRDGARTAIQRRGSGNNTEFFIERESGQERILQAELLQRVAASPELFSPNVLLRPVVQDYLLPTLAYTGGAAETAYFAQVGTVYELLAGRVTPIVPRFSATMVEPKIQRLLDRHQATILDVFGGSEALRQKLAERNLPQELQAAFDATSQSLDRNLAAIQEKLQRLDSTLVDAAQTAASKMRHQLERLYAQAARAEAQKVELVGRHAETLTQALYPNKGLQERSVGGLYFIARYGMELLPQLHDAIQTDCHDHQVLNL
jgi:bacillithiol biosynthesis cysteine-adding enzyme BshC